MEDEMTQLERAKRIIETTPGRIHNDVFKQAGVPKHIVWRAGMSLSCGFWRKK